MTDGSKEVGGVLGALQRAGSAIGLRLDSWQNALTGIGLAATDKTMAHTPSAVTRLSDATLERLYHGQGLPARIVDKPIEDGMRGGMRHVPPEETDDAVVAEVEEEWKRLKCWQSIREGSRWGRLYGDGAILLGIMDRGEMETPLDLEKVTEIRYLMVLEAPDYHPVAYYEDPDDELFGEPEIFQIVASIGTASFETRVHESRLIRFGGAPTARRIRREFHDRDYSVLQRPYDALRRFDSDWAAASAMMTDASIGVLKISGFRDVVAGGSKEAFETRCQLMNLGLSVSRTLPIDAESEEFSRVERSFAGIADLLDKSSLYFAAEVGWPQTKLFGRSPDGLNATGESDEDTWQAIVQGWRDEHLLPAAEILQGLVLRGLGHDPEGWSIELPDLEQESDAEATERRKGQAEIDRTYIEAEVFTPEEIALARVVNGQWTDAPPELDAEAMQAREALLEQDYERMKEEPEELEPGALPPGAGGPLPPEMAAQAEAAKAAAEGAPPGEVPTPPEEEEPEGGNEPPPEEPEEEEEPRRRR